ncbi:polygalacturonase inhibitor-like [Triticum urartu]|uniref:polygalacturonase inhibitor-like n=1 Tax=Triticum urartu TaxID=4572 RepID=UPI002044BEBC|nr:polygalacturonase inhibitor-like [Triticum urartu]
MNKIANGELPPVQFVANGRTYNYGYYLADGIYQKWQTFVKLLKKPEAQDTTYSTTHSYSHGGHKKHAQPARTRRPAPPPHAVDSAALVAVKAAFNNASYFASWTPDIPCCAWPGVDCEGSTGRVVSLDILLDYGVAGPVPGHAIAGLTRLRSLEVYKLPGVSGAIPAALARLSGLLDLTISQTGVSGPVSSFLARSRSSTSRRCSIFSSAGHLAFLDLSHNNLPGSIPADFLAVRFVLIDLSCNRLTGDASVLFGPGPGSTELVSVNLWPNAFSFDMSQVHLTDRLASLDVSHSRIYGHIPALVANLTELQSFDVSYNRLCGAVPDGAAARFGIHSFEHNRCLCGAPLPNPCH